MTYPEFKDTIQSALKKRRDGATWNEIKLAHDLPYERPCPEWTRRLEREIGLVRRKGNERALVWSLAEFSPQDAAGSRRRPDGGRVHGILK